jgi:hypothetical protein
MTFIKALLSSEKKFHIDTAAVVSHLHKRAALKFEIRPVAAYTGRNKLD